MSSAGGSEIRKRSFSVGDAGVEKQPIGRSQSLTNLSLASAMIAGAGAGAGSSASPPPDAEPQFIDLMSLPEVQAFIAAETTPEVSEKVQQAYLNAMKNSPLGIVRYKDILKGKVIKFQKECRFYKENLKNLFLPVSDMNRFVEQIAGVFGVSSNLVITGQPFEQFCQNAEIVLSVLRSKTMYLPNSNFKGGLGFATDSALKEANRLVGVRAELMRQVGDESGMSTTDEVAHFSCENSRFLGLNVDELFASWQFPETTDVSTLNSQYKTLLGFEDLYYPLLQTLQPYAHSVAINDFILRVAELLGLDLSSMLSGSRPEQKVEAIISHYNDLNKINALDGTLINLEGINDHAGPDKLKRLKVECVTKRCQEDIPRLEARKAELEAQARAQAQAQLEAAVNTAVTDIVSPISDHLTAEINLCYKTMNPEQTGIQNMPAFITATLAAPLNPNASRTQSRMLGLCRKWQALQNETAGAVGYFSRNGTIQTWKQRITLNDTLTDCIADPSFFGPIRQFISRLLHGLGLRSYGTERKVAAAFKDNDNNHAEALEAARTNIIAAAAA